MAICYEYKGQNFDSREELERFMMEEYIRENSNVPTSTEETIETTESTPQTETTETKKGVKEIFEENKELSEIGTEEQYSAYLNTVFPDSKVKDVVYRGGGTKLQPAKDSSFGSGFYFTPDKSYGSSFAENASSKGYGYKLTNAILNLKNPLIHDETKKEVEEIETSFGKTKREYKSIVEDAIKNKKNIFSVTSIANDNTETDKPLYEYKDGKYYNSRGKEINTDEIILNVDLQILPSDIDKTTVLKDGRKLT